MTVSSWLDELNAQRYEDYVRQYPMYRDLGRKMVELAQLQPGMTVIDLASGTGVVTGQIAAALGGQGKVIGVDMSGSMLAIARSKFPDLEFVVASAERLHEVVPEHSADLIVCNSAFWQMDVRQVLEEIKMVLKPAGRFIFNLGEGTRSVDSPPPVYLHDLIQQIATEEYGYTPPKLRRRQRPQPINIHTSLEDVEAFVTETPFILLAHNTMEIEHTAASHYAFNQIPVMTLYPLYDLDYPTRLEIVEKAYQKCDTSYKTITTWRFYVLTLRP